jgi:hypothetical protein
MPSNGSSALIGGPFTGFTGFGTKTGAAGTLAFAGFGGSGAFGAGATSRTTSAAASTRAAFLPSFFGLVVTSSLSIEAASFGSFVTFGFEVLLSSTVVVSGAFASDASDAADFAAFGAFGAFAPDWSGIGDLLDFVAFAGTGTSTEFFAWVLVPTGTFVMLLETADWALPGLWSAFFGFASEDDLGFCSNCFAGAFVGAAFVGAVFVATALVGAAFVATALVGAAFVGAALVGFTGGSDLADVGFANATFADPAFTGTAFTDFAREVFAISGFADVFADDDVAAVVVDFAFVGTVDSLLTNCFEANKASPEDGGPYHLFWPPRRKSASNARSTNFQSPQVGASVRQNVGPNQERTSEGHRRQAPFAHHSRHSRYFRQPNSG